MKNLVGQHFFAKKTLHSAVATVGFEPTIS